MLSPGTVAPAPGGQRGSRRVRSIVTMAVAGFMGLACNMPAAHAHRRDFPFTYDWYQPAKGEREIESHSRYLGEDNSFKQEIEFEYGVTDRFSVSPYIIFERGSGENLHYQGFKFESRYQLGHYKTGEVLPGLYLEFADEKNEPRELEGKLILSRFGRDGSNISFNYIVERPLEAGAEFENSYSVGYARPLGKSRYDLRGGVEWLHNFDSGHINAGPVLGAAFGEHFFVTAGYAFKLNRSATNGDQVRLGAECEF